MKVYEVKVEIVSADWGRHEGWKRIALVTNKNKGEEIAQSWIEEHEKQSWWMTYGGNAKNHINVVIEDLGEIIE